MSRVSGRHRQLLAVCAGTLLLLAQQVLATCNRPFADRDGDGDVDQVDFGHLQRCMTLPGKIMDPVCSCLDRNDDAKVDAYDMEAFLACESGPAIPADPACERWPSGLASDDFNSFNLDPALWTIVDPRGDCQVSLTGTNSGDARLEISVPARVSHRIWTDGITAPHVMQSINNTDFEIEARFESVVSLRFQQQGFLVQEDADTFIVFELYSDGIGTYYYTGVFHNGTVLDIANTSIPGGTPQYLRVTRKADSWTGSYSFDAVTWTNIAQFAKPMLVTQVGPFAANEENEFSPAFTALIDYVVNTGAPLLGEDTGIVQDVYPPNAFDVEGVAEADTAYLRWCTDEPASSVVQYGTTGQFELGSFAQVTLVRTHFQQIGGLSSGTTYQFRIASTDASGNTATSDLSLTAGTDPGGPVLDFWYGQDQEFGQLGTPQPSVNVLGNASDPDGINWLGYSLNGGPSIVLSRGPNGKRLAQSGDFNAELLYADLQPGPSQLVVRAVDAFGNLRFRQVTVHNLNQGPWPLPYSINWSQAASINSVAQILDGLWAIDAGIVYPTVVAYDRLIAVGDLSWQDYEVTVPITVYGVDPNGYAPPSNGPGVGIVCRWPGHSDDGSQPPQGIYPLGAIGLYRWTTTGDSFEILGNYGEKLAQAPSSDALQLATTYVFKFRVHTEPPVVAFRFKAWLAGQSEPADWKLVGHQPIVGNPLSGSAVLLAHHVDATFGNVTIVPVTTP